MAYGGGTFLVQNKVLPGAYINFVSKSYSSDIFGDRGYAAMGLELDWGPEGEVFTVTNGDFQTDSLKIFGYDYTDAKMQGLRELFLNVKTLYAYRLNGGGAKAANTYATAKYKGTRGNDIKIAIEANVDDNTKFDVITYLGTQKMDVQTVAAATGLLSNDWVDFKSDATLAVTAATALTGGTNGTANNAAHQALLSALESYTFNALGLVSDTAALKSLYTAYTKRMRDEVGLKFQTVVYNYTTADYEGVISVKNACTGTDVNAASLVYWVTGIAAGCEVNKSNMAKIYPGEYTVSADYTQAQLEAAINAGEFTLHKVNEDLRVLADINTLVTVSDTKGDDFKENQTIRVCDQIAMDIAKIFNTRYLGVVPNDKAGRASLWNDIVKHHQKLNDIRAIEDFDSSKLTVEQGDTKNSVVVYDEITPVNAMAKLYMTVTVA